MLVHERAADVREIAWTEKSPTDFVSEVDMAAEALVRDALLRRVPGATIVGEELSPADAAQAAAPERRARGVLPARGVAFVVDPLDGTTNFLHGYPEYAVSVGAALDGVLVAGAIVNAATGETFAALRGHGAWRDGERIAVSPITEPSRALLGTGFPFKDASVLPAYLAQMAVLMPLTSGLRRAGAAALDLANVACGRFEAFWELRLAPWDVAAGILLVREAGGVATDLAGRDAVADFGPLVVGSPVMHAWLLDRLRDAAASVRA